jgi:exodeoxyribonuclease-3
MRTSVGFGTDVNDVHREQGNEQYLPESLDDSHQRRVEVMRVLSWNVNGIRAAERKGFLAWIADERPDIICVQETKANPAQLSEQLLRPSGYETFWSSAERKGYSGVSVFSRHPPESAHEGLGIKRFDTEGRTLILNYGDFVLFNLYFPNGGEANLRVPFKLEFCEQFLKVAERYRQDGKKLLICGDFNTAHKEIDLARPKENEHNTGFLPEEREWLDRFVAKGYVDTLREFTDEPGHYTWWDYKTFARRRNIGWRLDYFFATRNMMSHVTSAFILPEVMGSDHCPVGVELDF